MGAAHEVILAYALPLTAIWVAYAWARRRAHVQSSAARAAAKEAGLFEPPSLHPLFDPTLCRGCGACVKACPEGDVIGLISGKAALIEPSQCIGHGACRAACPFGAISLVFGTEERGVDIPHVRPNFETNVPGVFIAGELGGMGLIRNAIEQGRQAVAAISRLDALGRKDRLDLVIVGAGPAGISASLAARERRLSSVTIEQESLGGTVAHFPRGKVVMTAPATLPLVGQVNFREITKEKLVAFWRKVVREHCPRIHFEERVERVVPLVNGFEVATTRGLYRTRSVLLAIGRRGTPRTLGVPGEELPKVVYRLSDAEQYKGKHILVVGGGDSALEAATALGREEGTNVTLSYRGDGFTRAKMKNRQALDEAVTSGQLSVLLGSKVLCIAASSVDLECGYGEQRIQLRNDAVVVCAGGILPTSFIKSIGINVETKHGTA